MGKSIPDRDKKRDGLIFSYYLSRCNDKAVRALGFKSFNAAFKGLAELINDNPNNIKNMRDEFDPYFDNGRRGWYQRELRPSRRIIFDEMEKLSDSEVERMVKNIINAYKKRGDNRDSCVLKNLRALIKQSSEHYTQNFVWQDVVLTDEFKIAYEDYLNRNKWQIEYNNATSIITSPTEKNIFVPNQWYAIAAYAVCVYDELSEYKKYFEKISDIQGEKRDVYAKKLRNEPSTVDRALFIETGEKMFRGEGQTQNDSEKDAGRLWRFLTDYSWWSGQKTADRGDFYVSVVLNMLNLVNSSQGYVGDIVNAYGTDQQLKTITRNLESFTKNMTGITYVSDIPEEGSDYINNGSEKCDETNKIKEGKGRATHKIVISQESLDKIGKQK